MKTKHIAFILLSFIILSVLPARADEIMVQGVRIMPPAGMNDAALASYISGRLKEALGEENYNVSDTCDAESCTVSVIVE
jgi:hypothetical protein